MFASLSPNVFRQGSQLRTPFFVSVIDDQSFATEAFGKRKSNGTMRSVFEREQFSGVCFFVLRSFVGGKQRYEHRFSGPDIGVLVAEHDTRTAHGARCLLLRCKGVHVRALYTIAWVNVYSGRCGFTLNDISESRRTSWHDLVLRCSGAATWRLDRQSSIRTSRFEFTIHRIDVSVSVSVYQTNRVEFNLFSC